jgi:hypothetical protein
MRWFYKFLLDITWLATSNLDGDTNKKK